ncbi:MAG: GNAT family N-acetyltransferase [Candidatus Saliniplasma sp.]
MEIVTYEDVDDDQMTELTLTCFNHPYSKQHVIDMIEADQRVPRWGGELYAKEDEKVLGTVGLLFPKVKTKEGTETVGGIRNVCTRPSASRRGVSTKLLNRAHEMMEEKDVRFSFLMTDRSNVAHNLYEKFGYRDILAYPSAYKKIKSNGENEEIELKEEEDPEYIRKTYLKSVEGLTGLVVREKDFWEMANARGWPENKNVRIAYKDGKRIGYLMLKGGRDQVICEEIAVEDEKDLPILLKKVENNYDKEYFVIKFVNPNYVDILSNYGFNYYDDRWGVVMVKDFDKNPEETLELLGYEQTFYNSIYESF